MALDASKLLRVGPQNSNGPTLWVYASGTDAVNVVDNAGYFNDVADRLQVGDIIFVTPDTGAAGILKVDSNTRDLSASPPVKGVVDCINGLSLGTVDSD
jgi:hypothetical protein